MLNIVYYLYTDIYIYFFLKKKEDIEVKKMKRIIFCQCTISFRKMSI